MILRKMLFCGWTGSLGSNPRKISGLFKAMGVGYKRFYKVDEAQAAVDEGKPVIVSYHIGLNIFQRYSHGFRC